MAVIKSPKLVVEVEGKEKINEGVERNKEKLSIPPIGKVERNVLQAIVGQDMAVRKIITAIYRSIYFKSLKTNILVIGKSGTGKTETLKQLAQAIGMPYTIEDATKYTKEGYVGDNVEDMLYNLLDAADYDVEKAEYGMIIIDEIDKKAGKDPSDVSGVQVLKSLLKLVEGVEIHLNYGGVFNTSNLIIVFCGAFSGLDKVRKKRLKPNTIGFNTKETVEQDLYDGRKFTNEDLVNYGLPEEFVGRIDTIVEMNPLGKEKLVKILRDSRLSIFRRYQKELKKCGVALRYDAKLFDLIAEEAIKTDTGARGLTNIVNYVFEDIIYQIMLRPRRYHRCEMELEIVRDNTRYRLS